MYLPSTSCGELGLLLHRVLDELLEYKTDGVFVEVGANDGYTGSFTYNLARIGWKGVYCEPVTDIYNECVKNHSQHPNVTTRNVAVGDKPGRLNILEAGTLSTMDAETFQMYKKCRWAWNNLHKSTGVKSVEVDTLDHILEENGVEPNFDLFVLDVEGYEDRVLRGFSIEKYNPKIIIVEIPDQYDMYVDNEVLMKKYKVLREYFKQNGYNLLMNDIVDNIYVKSTEKLPEIAKDIKFPQYGGTDY